MFIQVLCAKDNELLVHIHKSRLFTQAVGETDESTGNRLVCELDVSTVEGEANVGEFLSSLIRLGNAIGAEDTMIDALAQIMERLLLSYGEALKKA